MTMSEQKITRVREMVEQINQAAHLKPVRFFKKGNGINTEDIVLYAIPENPVDGEVCLLLSHMEEDDLIVYLPQGHQAYEISPEEMEHALERIRG